MAFKLIRTDDADLTRVQQNVQQALTEVAAERVGVVEYASASGPLTRKVTATERYILASPRGGPIRVVLPRANAQQVVSVTNITDSRNAVEIVIDDGTPFTDGTARIMVPAHETREVASAGSAWSPL